MVTLRLLPIFTTFISNFTGKALSVPVYSPKLYLNISYILIYPLDIYAEGKIVPQAWIDVQAKNMKSETADKYVFDIGYLEGSLQRPEWSETVSRVIPLRYPGGKYYALAQLRQFYSSLEHDEYREPFAGGATVFFSKHLVKYNWLNDIDKELINLYQVMANAPLRSQLVAMLSKEVASKQRWQEVRKLNPQTSLGRAFKYYYLNRTSFSGKLSSPAWGYRPKRSLPPERWYERIIPCGRKLEHAKLTCLDFSEVIHAPKVGKNLLLYVDPPYYSPPKHKHYVGGFEMKDHLRLRDLLRNTEYNFMLTYDDVPAIREMYDWAFIYPISFYYRVGNSQTQHGRRRRGSEIVITNYRIPEIKRIEDYA